MLSRRTRMTSKKMESGINNITQHAFGNRDNCQEWCGCLADPNNYKHQTLPYGKDLKNEDLKGSLSKLFSVYASNAEKLSKLYGFWQSFVTIGSCNHLMRIISMYVGNTKKSEIS